MNAPDIRPTFSSAIDYVVVREIDRGGMGSVYEAVQCGIEGFSKRVALKVLLPELSGLRRMFTAEARLVADLVHQNIVQTLNLGEVDGQLFIAMEYIHGLDLNAFSAALIAHRRQLPDALAAYVMSRVCRALHFVLTRQLVAKLLVGGIQRPAQNRASQNLRAFDPRLDPVKGGSPNVWVRTRGIGFRCRHRDRGG